MPETKVAIRLGTDGKAQVQNDFREVERAGTQAMDKIAMASTQAGQAGETAAERQINAWKRQAAAAESAARAQARNAQFSSVLGVRDIDSRASAARLRDLEAAFAVEERGLNRTQRVVAQASILNFTQQVAAGTPVLRAFITQASDIPTVLAADEGGIAGGLAKARAALTPFRIALAGTAAVAAVGVGAFLSYNNAVADLDRLSAGSARTLGLTGAELNAIAVAAAEASSLTTGAAREILTGYVQAGGVGRDVLQGLIALTEDFAAATGRDAKDAVGELAAAFADPVKGAEELARRYGLLDQAQVQQIRTLVESNDRTSAQKLLLEQLAPLLDGSAEKLGVAASGWSRLADRIDGAWQALGRFLDDLSTVDAEERLARDRLNKRFSNFLGFDTPALDASIAAQERAIAAQKRQREEGARAAQANIEAQRAADDAAREAANRQRQRQAEAKRLADEARRQREAEARERQQFIRRIAESIADEERQAEERQRRLQENLSEQRAAGARRIASLQDQARFAGDDSPAARLELVRRDALRDAAANPDLNSAQIAAQAALAVAEEQARIDVERAQLLADINSGQAQFVDLLALANALKRVGIDLTGEEGRSIVEKLRAQQRATAALEEQRRFGEQLLDTVFNPQNWRSWGDLGRQVLRDIGNEFIRLAALNPLKNLLFGGNLPTLFGGDVIPGFDIGTPWFGGGAAWVGENGPERVILPRGSQVDSAQASRRMMMGSGGSFAQVVQFDLRGAVTTADLIAQMNDLAQQAAVRGAAGGATMARADLARRGRRRLF